ncbi:MAG: 50S ribosomal protein L17 [Planctomycetaceae bacterium]|jgi:large subunit ribosomal protein L17|nr:50S ribosomal protein L17 [Planctomycetaceae bacterium]
MRHRKSGRKFGRNPNHQRALLRSLASAIFLTEKPDSLYGEKDPRPKKPGRIVTTLEKAKEVRPLVEKCITIAKKAQKHLEAAGSFATTAARNSEEWRQWRNSESWQQWNAAIAPAIALRRRAIQLIGDKKAVSILFDIVAPRFLERNGGYTRILKLAIPRLGDSGKKAILEFVGQNDRQKQQAVAIPIVKD